MRKKITVAIVSAILIILLVLIGIVIRNSYDPYEPPYVIENDKLSSEYLSEQIILANLESNGTLINVKDTTADILFYFSEESPDERVASISVGETKELLTITEEYLDTLQCREGYSESDSTSESLYYIGVCDDFAYYVYKVENKWITFETSLGEEKLKEMIADYLE